MPFPASFRISCVTHIEQNLGSLGGLLGGQFRMRGDNGDGIALIVETLEMPRSGLGLAEQTPKLLIPFES